MATILLTLSALAPHSKTPTSKGWSLVRHFKQMHEEKSSDKAKRIRDTLDWLSSTLKLTYEKLVNLNINNLILDEKCKQLISFVMS